MTALSSLSYGRLINTFYQEMSKPSDNTDCFWYMNRGDFHFSEEGETNPDPESWNGYSSDQAHSYHEKNGYVTVTLDDGCGGQYQAFFDLEKKVNPLDY